jgi:heme/copper-type cytochrome/quinol oxidase subunit 2
MSNRAIFVAVAVVALLALGWMWTRPQPAPNATVAAPQAPAPPSPSEAPPPPSPAKHLQVAIENSKPGVTVAVLKATQGDDVTIDITTDRAGTVEIHGYQKKIEVTPGQVATLSFVANIAGRFPVDLHGRDGRHVDVTALEVQPR